MDYRKSLIKLILIFGCGGFGETQQIAKCSTGAEFDEALEEAVPNLKNCLIANLENFRHTVASNTCHDGSIEINECNLNLENAVINCQSNDQQYFPERVLKIVKNYADYICNKAQSFKFLLDHEICFPSLSHGINCLNNFKFFNSSITNISQEDMCLDELQVRDCLMEYADNMCPKDEIFPKFINETFIVDEFPCKGSAIFQNLFLTSLSMALIIFTPNNVLL